jgi:hypothetical protein
VRVRVYATREEAEVARSARDTAAGFPRTHTPDEITIAERGAAADRILARGVRTEHLVGIMASHDETEFAVPSDDDDPQAIDIDPDIWRGAGRPRPRPSES